MSSGTSQQFCVRWNSHLGSLGAAFPQLLAGQRFVDVTLACEGHQLHCHRLVLAACSTYFESLLGENPCKHPIIILPRDIKLWEIQALVDFMYKGEVNVSQAGLSDLLKCAEILQIRGLCGSDAALNLNQVNSTTATASTATTPAATTTTTTPTTMRTATTLSGTSQQTTTNAAIVSTTAAITTQNAQIINRSSTPNSNNDRSETDSPTSQHHQQQQQNSNESSPQLVALSVSGGGGAAANLTNRKKSSLLRQQQQQQQQQQQLHHTDTSPFYNKIKSETQQPEHFRTASRIQKIEPIDVSMDDEIDDDDSINPPLDKTDDDSISGKYIDYLEGTKSENQQHLTQTQQQQQNDQEKTANSCPLPTASSTTTTAATTTATYLNNNNHQCNNFNTNDDDDGIDLIGENIDDIIVVNDENDSGGGGGGCGNYPPESDRMKKSTVGGVGVALNSTNFRGKIRVKSNENLFENYAPKRKPLTAGGAATAMAATTLRSKNQTSRFTNNRYRSVGGRPTAVDDTAEVRLLPGSLRFNRKSMTIYLKSIKDKNERRVNGSGSDAAAASGRRVGEADETAAIKTEFDILDESNFESIICSPNLLEMAYDHVDEDDDDEDDDGGGGGGGSTAHTIGEADVATAIDYAGSPVIIDTDFDDIKIDDEIMYDGTSALMMPAELLQFGGSGGGGGGGETSSSDHDTQKFSDVQIYDINGRSIDLAMAQFLASKIDEANANGTLGVDEIGGLMNLKRASLSSDTEIDGYGTAGDLMSSSSSAAAGQHHFHHHHHHRRHLEHLGIGDGEDGELQPSLSAVVLRNPRSNQPRTYSTDALYAALMDVKAGESIYRASQIHKVPRKTLRNWMKRWHIKSAYPMPRQLKQAAEKKKRIQQQLGKMAAVHSSAATETFVAGAAVTSLSTEAAQTTTVMMSAASQQYHQQQQQQQHHHHYNHQRQSTAKITSTKTKKVTSPV